MYEPFWRLSAKGRGSSPVQGSNLLSFPSSDSRHCASTAHATRSGERHWTDYQQPTWDLVLSITGGGRPMAVGVARLPLIFSLLLLFSSGHPLPFAKPLTSTCLDPALVFEWGRHQIGKDIQGHQWSFAVWPTAFFCVICFFSSWTFLYFYMNICHFERGAGIWFFMHSIHGWE